VEIQPLGCNRNFTFNADGDIGFNTTPTTREKYEFHASENEIRYTWGREAEADMEVGEPVCFYGRSSNIRSCNHNIMSTNVVLLNYGGVPEVGNLVRVSNTTSNHPIGGDSGGGWSWNNTAWGVTSGASQTTSVFTSIEQAEVVFDLELF